MISLERDAIIGDRYRLCRPLGEGGMGWVWEARDGSTDARCALKFLKRDKEDDRRRFHREVRAAAAVRHPNVIDVHELLELPDGTLVMVMDLLEGESLGAALRRERSLALADLAAILVPVASALEAAHAVGIIHRDLKPDNIFLSRQGADTVVKVLDFGAAKLTGTEGLAASTGAEALTNTGSIVGTPYYMSPEQVFSEKDLDARADIWSLGVVIYECLCGSRPTEADTIGQVLKRIMKADFAPISSRCDDLPEDVASMVVRMLSAERDARPSNVGEIRDVLVRHAAPRVIGFTGSAGDAPVDPSAETHPVWSAAPEGVTGGPPRERAASSGRGDTHGSSALSISVVGPKLRRRTSVVAIAAVALMSGLIAWRALRSTAHDSSDPIPMARSAAASETPAREQTVASVAPVPSAALAASATASASLAPVVVTMPARVPTLGPSHAGKPAPPAASTVAPAMSAVWNER